MDIFLICEGTVGNIDGTANQKESGRRKERCSRSKMAEDEKILYEGTHKDTHPYQPLGCGGVQKPLGAGTHHPKNLWSACRAKENDFRGLHLV